MEIISQLIINSLIAASLYAMLALGFNLVYGTTKVFNIAHGALAVVGAYGVLQVSKILGMPYAVGIFCGIVGAGCVGMVLDIFIYRPLRARKASLLVLLIASLGAFTAIQALVAMFFSSQFQSLPTGEIFQKVIIIYGGSITVLQILMIATAIMLYAALWFVLVKTDFGKTVRAISDDEEVARIVGIKTDHVIGKIFFIGSAIAGLAGIFLGFDVGIQPTNGMYLLLSAAIASIVGGIGNVTGGILGALLLGFAENFGIWHISSQWKAAIAFGLLILFLIVKPSGIMNVPVKK